MKNLLIILFLAGAPALYAGGVTDIIKAFNTGDVSALSKYFDNSVEISVLGEQNVYSKNEGTEVLRNFFSKNKPRSFNQVHQGTSKGKDSHYCIGDLVAGGTSYRVYIYMKNNGDTPLIQEIRVDKA